MVERVDEHDDRFDALPERRVEPDIVCAEVSEQLAAADTEQVGHRHVHAELGEHGVRLGFQPGAEPDELGPIADQLTPLPHLRRRDPCFGEHPRSQQIAEQLTITLIVLHPSILERTDLRRGDQMHIGPAAVQCVDSPVPAVGRFDRHLRILARLEHLGDQASQGRSPDGSSRAPHRRRPCASPPTGDDADRSEHTLPSGASLFVGCCEKPESR